jgi:hypothetical protein
MLQSDYMFETVLVRVNKTQIDLLKTRYPLLSNEKNTAIVRIALNILMDEDVNSKFLEDVNKPNSDSVKAFQLLKSAIKIARQQPNFRRYPLKFTTKPSSGLIPVILSKDFSLSNFESFVDAIKQVIAAELEIVKGENEPHVTLKHDLDVNVTGNKGVVFESIFVTLETAHKLYPNNIICSKEVKTE